MHKPLPDVYVIGLGHKARHGKDTTASHIIKATGGIAERHAFADDLYAIARVIFGMTTKDGSVLQWLGTEGFRKKDPNTWINSMYWKLHYKRPKIVVIPDVRFPNEAEFVKNMGGTLIKVARYNKDGSSFVVTDRDPNHPSETALDSYSDWDYTIENYELGQLKHAVDDVMWDLRDRIGTFNG